MLRGHPMSSSSSVSYRDTSWHDGTCLLVPNSPPKLCLLSLMQSLRSKFTALGCTFIIEGEQTSPGASSLLSDLFALS